MSRADLVLARSAINNRWPISDAIKQKVIATCEKLLDSGKPRDQVAAMKTLAAIEGQNQKDELANQEAHDFRERFIELALAHGISRTVLGIEEAAEETATETTS